MKLKIYIVGPYSNTDKTIRDQNIEKAKQAAKKIWNSGNYAFCPHLNTARFEDDPECTASYQDFIDGTLSFMYDCHCLYVLSGYEKSKGSVGEIAAAIEHGKPVFYQDKGEFPHYDSKEAAIAAAICDLEERENLEILESAHNWEEVTE